MFRTAKKRSVHTYSMEKCSDPWKNVHNIGQVWKNVQKLTNSQSSTQRFWLKSLRAAASWKNVQTHGKMFRK
jgi:hypothetical protein